MINIALAGNPNCGKTTLFNSLTGSTAHVGNWPGVTVEKREGICKLGKEKINVIDLPGVYSLSPYTPEEVISRNVILGDDIDCVLNIVDSTNLVRNLYLTTQILEMNKPVVIALNMMDVLKETGKIVDIKKISDNLHVPVIEISALKEQNLNDLVNLTIEEANKKRNGECFYNDKDLLSVIFKVEKILEEEHTENPLYHAIKLLEEDEVELKDHKNLLNKIAVLKENYHNKIFGNDFEALIADARYNFLDTIVSIKEDTKISKKNKSKMEQSKRLDKIFTNKWVGIPLFIVILFFIFHFTFSEDLFFLHTFGVNFGTNFEGSMFENLFYSPNGINSLGVFITNFVDSITGWFTNLVRGWLSGTEVWATALVCDAILGGLFALIGFLPQILLIFLFFSILEDTGYMARVAFILDRIFRKLGVSGRAFLPMIMGLGCSVPAMMNTRTLSNEKERIATIRVIPFFSCGAKLPILTGCIGAIVLLTGVGYADLITLAMYLLGMIVALCSLLFMKKTMMRGETSTFIMELPNYHIPQFKSLMIHLRDKAKGFIKKAFTVIFLSILVIWFLQSFTPSLQYIPYDSEQNKFLTELTTNDSILANIGRSLQVLFTPMGFGSQLGEYGWVFAVAAITGLVAKENVISTFAMLSAVVTVGNPQVGPSLVEGANDVANMINATGANIPAIISFIAFNMLTIPCFAAVAAAKSELKKGTLKYTIAFWIITSFIVGTAIYTIGTWWWSLSVWVIVIILAFAIIHFVNLYKDKKHQKETV